MLSILTNGNYTGLNLVAIIFAYLLAIVIAIVLHEFAHGYVAYKCGDPTAKMMGRLSLNPIKHFDPLGFICLVVAGFGWAKPVPINPMNFKSFKRDSVLVSLAGVTANFICVLIFSLLYVVCIKFITILTPIALFATQFCLYMTLINFMLMVFNLIPIYPLDGFNAIASRLSYENKFVQFNKQFGPFLLIILFIGPWFSMLLNLMMNGILQPLFSLWLNMFGV